MRTRIATIVAATLIGSLVTGCSSDGTTPGASDSAVSTSTASGSAPATVAVSKAAEAAAPSDPAAASASVSSSQAAAGDSPSASTAPSESAVADDPEGKFVAALDAAGIVYTSRYNAIALGRATCADRADGRTDDEIARDITDYSDYTDAQAGTIIAAARSNFCA